MAAVVDHPERKQALIDMMREIGTDTREEGRRGSPSVPQSALPCA
jgi:hypothetical protein